MERKFVLLIKTEDLKYCWKGERTREQIEKDLKKLGDLGELEILPILGKTGGPGKLPILALSGLVLVGLGTFIYRRAHENLCKRRKRC